MAPAAHRRSSQLGRQMTIACRHPWWSSRENDERGNAHEENCGKPSHVAHPLVSVANPQRNRCSHWHAEVSEIHHGANNVVPTHRSSFIEVALHPHVWVGTKKEEPVDVTWRKDLNGHAELIGNSAAVVVGKPHGHKKRKVAQHQPLAFTRSPEVSCNEATEHPCKYGDAVGGDPVGDSRPNKCNDVCNECSGAEIPQLHGNYFVASSSARRTSTLARCVRYSALALRSLCGSA